MGDDSSEASAATVFQMTIYGSYFFWDMIQLTPVYYYKLENSHILQPDTVTTSAASLCSICKITLFEPQVVFCPSVILSIFVQFLIRKCY